MAKIEDPNDYFRGHFESSICRRAKVRKRNTRSGQPMFITARHSKAKAAVTGARPDGSPVPGRVGDASPIKYVIYIVKENRTYDQVLGDMKEGNGEPRFVFSAKGHAEPTQDFPRICVAR